MTFARLRNAPQRVARRTRRLLDRRKPGLAVIVLGHGDLQDAAITALAPRTARIGAIEIYRDAAAAKASRLSHVAFVDAGATPTEEEVATLAGALAFERAAVLPHAGIYSGADAALTAAAGGLAAFPAARAITDHRLSLDGPGQALVLNVLNADRHHGAWKLTATPATHSWSATPQGDASTWAGVGDHLTHLDVSPRMKSSALATATYWQARAGASALASGMYDGLRTQAVNATTATELVITYAFPPFLDTSGLIVARKFANRDHTYDVVTQDMSSLRPSDPRALDLVNSKLGRHTVLTGRPALGRWGPMERFCTQGMNAIEYRLAQQGPYESLYSRSMWPASSMLAAWYKARHPKTPWVAEISDPYSISTDGSLRHATLPDNEITSEINSTIADMGRAPYSGDNVFEACEWVVYALADRIVFTNENQRDFMLSRFPDPDLAQRALSISEVQHHPVPTPDFYELGSASPALDDSKITIAYFGRFYPVRSADDLLEPFSMLTAAQRERVELLIFTQDFAATTEAVSHHPARDCVRVLDALPYLDFLATARAADWLLLADAHRPPEFDINPYLPSKYADYAGSGTPIWAMVDETSVLSRKPLAATSPLGDAAAAYEVLSGIVHG